MCSTRDTDGRPELWHCGTVLKMVSRKPTAKHNPVGCEFAANEQSFCSLRRPRQISDRHPFQQSGFNQREDVRRPRLMETPQQLLCGPDGPASDLFGTDIDRSDFWVPPGPHSEIVRAVKPLAYTQSIHKFRLTVLIRSPCEGEKNSVPQRLLSLLLPFRLTPSIYRSKRDSPCSHN